MLKIDKIYIPASQKRFNIVPFHKKEESQEKEKARRTIDSLVKDTLLKRHLLLLTENPQEVIDATIP